MCNRHRSTAPTEVLSLKEVRPGVEPIRAYDPWVVHPVIGIGPQVARLSQKSPILPETQIKRGGHEFSDREPAPAFICVSAHKGSFLISIARSAVATLIETATGPFTPVKSGVTERVNRWCCLRTNIRSLFAKGPAR